MKSNRTIKFRAWDKDLSRMFNQVSEIDFADGLVYCFVGKSDNEEDSQSEYMKIRNFILMQFTGLLDKNGKEIYEGDIVENGSGNVWQIAIQNGAFGYKFSRKKIKFDKDLQTWSDEMVVLGNIYENPELLKGESELQAEQDALAGEAQAQAEAEARGQYEAEMAAAQEAEYEAEMGGGERS